MTMYSSDFSSSSGGSSVLKIQPFTSDGLCPDWNYYIPVDTSSGSGNVIITLPQSTPNSLGKTILIKKTSNDNNAVCIKANSTNSDKLNGSSTSYIYLYSKDDCVSVISSADKQCETSVDNRNSTGSSASYLTATTSVAQSTNLGANDHIKFDTVLSSYGNKITLDTSSSYTTSTGASIGRLTLKAGSDYNIDFDPSFMATTSGAWGQLALYDVTNSATICQSGWQSFSATNNTSYPTITYTHKAVVDTIIEIRINIGSGAVTLIGSTATQKARIRISEANRQATVLNTVDYLEVARITSDQTGMVTSTDFIFNSIISGNIPYNIVTGISTLTAGKTYELIGEPFFNNFSTPDVTAIYYTWVDATSNTPLIGSTQGQGCNLPVTNGNAHYATSPLAHIIYTPSSNQNVKLRVITVSGTASLSTNSSKAVIKQIGSSAVSSVPLNLISAISDKSSSGYFDIGTMRMQWGTSATNLGSQPTITLPAPFANNSYSVVPVIVSANTGTMFSIVVKTLTTTSFTVNKLFLSGGVGAGCIAEGFTWQAIGLKP